MRTLSLLACCLLSACATVGSCPPVKDYPPEFRARLADEILALPENSAVLQALTDCYVLRQQVRSCRE